MLTKKRILIYVAILLVIVLGIILALTLRDTGANVPSSGYTYLKYKDGIFTGEEKTEFGSIKVEVTIKDAKIDNIAIKEMPQKLLRDYPGLKDEAATMIENIVKTQSIAQTDSTNDTAYTLNKMIKAIRNALDQSFIVQ